MDCFPMKEYEGNISRGFMPFFIWWNYEGFSLVFFFVIFLGDFIFLSSRKREGGDGPIRRLNKKDGKIF